MIETGYDAIVVGAGPNGLAAAITLARAGKSVVVLEAKDTIGGGARTGELTLPGFRHDICSAIHPLGIASPFFRSLPLADLGFEWVFPTAALAHPLDDGSAVMLTRLEAGMIAGAGKDEIPYRRLMQPFVDNWDALLEDILGPLPLPPRHPFLLARFGLNAIQSAQHLAESRFEGERAKAIFAGLAAHSMLPLERSPSASFGLVLGTLAHAVGWPIPKGGSQGIVDAMARYLHSMGGEIITGVRVSDLKELPKVRAILLDITPRQLLKLAGEGLSQGYRRQLERYRYGPGVFKVDYALDGPPPWSAVECRLAGTVHLGGTLAEIKASEKAVWRGEHPEKPFVIVAQQSLFDPTRAPQGKHTLWAYCHVPSGSSVDMIEKIEDQIERFAPGFKDLILARRTHTSIELEQYNPNYVGGDINGGVQDLGQLFTRPVMKLRPYATSLKGVYLCSSATPPGGGVHGMCGYHAALEALRREFSRRGE